MSCRHFTATEKGDAYSISSAVIDELASVRVAELTEDKKRAARPMAGLDRHIARSDYAKHTSDSSDAGRC